MTTEITVEILRESERAIFVTDGTVEEWLPKSQIEYDDTGSNVVVITLPEWLAQEKNLI